MRGGKLGSLLVAVAGMAVLAGCGSSSSTNNTAGSGGTTGAAKAAPTVTRKGAAPGGIIDRGYYAGVTCADSHCSDFHLWEHNAVLWCKGQGWSGKVVELPRVNSSRRPLYVCFRVVPANPTQTQANPNLVKSFYAKQQLIVGQGHIQSDKFSTSENGQNIDGEWFGTDEVQGKFGRSDTPPLYYIARWYGPGPNS